MPRKKNEVHVYIKYNHSLAVQIYEISNKTLKRCKIAHCNKSDCHYFYKTQFIETKTETIIRLLATIKHRMKKINYLSDLYVLLNHHKSLIHRRKINYMYLIQNT